MTGGAHLRQKWRKPPRVCYHASHRDRKGLKKVAVGVEELGRGVQVLVGQRFKCFNGAFLGTVEKLFSLIIRQVRSTALWGGMPGQVGHDGKASGISAPASQARTCAGEVRLSSQKGGRRARFTLFFAPHVPKRGTSGTPASKME